MEDVGAYKAQNKIPVEDVEREKIVLSKVKELAAAHGLDHNSMERFFIAQISAAKAIQYRHRAELLTRVIPTRPIDLQSDIRPELDRLDRFDRLDRLDRFDRLDRLDRLDRFDRLDRLDSDIVKLFATALQSRSAIAEERRERFMSTLKSRLLVDAGREALFDAMLEVRRSQ